MSMAYDPVEMIVVSRHLEPRGAEYILGESRIDFPMEHAERLSRLYSVPLYEVPNIDKNAKIVCVVG